METLLFRFIRSVVIAFAITAIVLIPVNLYFDWLELNSSSQAVSQSSFYATVVTVLPWGFGFAVMALIMITRIELRRDVVVASLFLSSYAMWGVFVQSSLFIQNPAYSGIMQFFHALTHIAGLRFTQVFPRVLRAEDLKTAGPTWFRSTVSLSLGKFLDPRIYWPIAVAAESLVLLARPNTNIESLHLLVLIFLAAYFLYCSYSGGSEKERKRIYWVLEGVLVFLFAEIVVLAFMAVVASGLIDLDLNSWIIWIRALSAWPTAACFAMAIFFAGAFDSRIIVKRTTALGIATGITLLIFVTAETVMAEFLSAFFDLESRAGGIVGGIIAALVLRPLTVRIESLLDRASKSERESGESR